MRNIDAVQQSRVEQQVAAIGLEQFVVDQHVAHLTHHCTSRRIGRMCLVWRTCAWSKAATRRNVPVVIGT